MLRDIQTKERKAYPTEYKTGGRTLSVDGRTFTDTTPAHLTDEEKRAAKAWLKQRGFGIDVGRLLPQNVRAIGDLQRMPAGYQPSKQYTTSTPGRKYSPEEVAAAMADFKRRYPPKLAARECMPYQEQLDTALRAWQVAVKRLGLEGANIDLRWFDRIETNVTGNVGRGWKAVTFPTGLTRRPAAFYDHQGRDVWVSANLEPADVARCVAHELRHAWQHRYAGPDYFDGYRASYPDHEAERDAKAFASGFINDGTWTWRNW